MLASTRGRMQASAPTTQGMRRVLFFPTIIVANKIFSKTPKGRRRGCLAAAYQEYLFKD